MEMSKYNVKNDIYEVPDKEVSANSKVRSELLKMKMSRYNVEDDIYEVPNEEVSANSKACSKASGHADDHLQENVPKLKMILLVILLMLLLVLNIIVVALITLYLPSICTVASCPEPLNATLIAQGVVKRISQIVNDKEHGYFDTVSNELILQLRNQVNGNQDMLINVTQDITESLKLLIKSTDHDMLIKVTQDIAGSLGSLIKNTDQLFEKAIDILLNITEDNMGFVVKTAESTLSSLQGLESNLSKLDGISQENRGSLLSSMQKIENVVDTLSIIQNISFENSKVANNTFFLTKEVSKTLNESTVTLDHVSCKDILDRHPGSPNGYYSANGEIVYCKMGELCGSDEGWTRLGYLDMANTTMACPSEFKLSETEGIRGCDRATNEGASCASVNFSSNGISYSEICGRVVGYQYGSTNAIHRLDGFGDIAYEDINSYYVDGVSITRGSPRQHVWTLMAGSYDSRLIAVENCACNCPCGNSSTDFLQFESVQSFIGNEYFCESGNPTNLSEEKLYIDDPLWDGEGCGSSEKGCCSASGPPWFHHKIVESTTDYIELRNCCDQATSNEDIIISLYEIYVK